MRLAPLTPVPAPSAWGCRPAPAALCQRTGPGPGPWHSVRFSEAEALTLWVSLKSVPSLPTRPAWSTWPNSVSHLWWLLAIWGVGIIPPGKLEQD